MSNDQDLSQEDKKAPAVDSNPGSDPNVFGSDEIIELTDVVGESKDPLEPDADAPLLLDEEEPDHDQIKLPEDITAEGLEPPSLVTEEMEEAFPANDFSALESSDFRFENTSAFEAADMEPFPAQSKENLDHVLAGLDGNDKADEKPGSAVTHDIPGISEEKMKELLTEVIQETVDKAVRETVAEVAEKVIREAIDALKQSIASSDAVNT